MKNSDRPLPARLLRPVFVLAPVGVVAFAAYVVGGLLFGLLLLSAAASRALPSELVLPVIGERISLPRIPFPGASPLAFVPDWTGADRVNLLLLGVDQREDERDRGLPTRSDTVMVASIHPVEKTAALISFPRDLWVTIPGFGEERINAAYRFGELRRTEGGGAAVAAHTVERNFGIRAPYYVLVDFGGFQEIINTLGGIVVDVPRPIKDEEYPTSDYGLERLYVLPGPQIMNGATALRYARTRHSDSDFARMARQQQILIAIRDRVLSLNLLAQLPSLLEQGTRTVQTNLSPLEVLSLAKLASQIEMEGVTSLVVERDLVTSFQGIEGASLLLPKRAEIQRAIQRTFADSRIVAEDARIEISSPAGQSALARQVADRLANLGLQNVRLTTLRGPELSSTSVVVSSQKPRSLAALLGALGLPPESLLEAAQEVGIDFRVVLGRDFQLP